MTSCSSPQLAVLTFNLLAPCYKRLFNSSGQERRDREQHHEHLWATRLDSILGLLTSITPTPDVIALQEFWFNPSFRSRFECVFSPHFHIFYAKRPGSKQDGLATLVRRSSALLSNPTQVAAFPLAKGDRIGLAVEAALESPSSDGPLSTLLIVNTHLTFPHCYGSRCLRESQADALTDFVSSYISAATRPVSALVLGDFNSDMHSKVCNRMTQAKFVNCYTSVNGEASHPATHFNHMHQQVFVDHVFLRNHPAPLTVPKRKRRLSGMRSGADDAAAHQQRRASSTSRRSRTISAVPRAISPSPVAIRDMYEDSALQSDFHGDPNAACGQTAKCSIRPIASTVYPKDIPTEKWPSAFDVSDHRPVGVLFDFESAYEDLVK